MFDRVTKDALAPLFLRIALAVVFILHGYPKVFDEGNEMGAAWANQMPEPPTSELQQAVAWGEFVGGIALAIGLLTRVAALGIIVIMGGAIYHVHVAHGFALDKGGYEYNFVLIAMCLALMFGGAGTLSIDGFFRRKPKKE